VMLEQAQLTAESLVQSVNSLFADGERLMAMGEAAYKLSHPNAAREIAEIAAQLAERRDSGKSDQRQSSG